MAEIQKLAITLWNFKGGVGKSTISLILAEIAAKNGLNVLAIDLDEQGNLAHTLGLTGGTFPTLTVRTTLEPSFAEEDFDFFVLDTHPAKDNVIKAAFNFADIVFVPVLGDYHSIINLRSAFDYVTSAGVDREQVAIIKNCMSTFKLASEVEIMLDEQGYPSAGRLPRSNILVRNIAAGYSWDKSMRPQQRKPFLELYDQIWRAYENMCAGNFNNLWRS